MITRVYRVTQVLAGASTVARIDGADAEGHALRFEVPKDEAQGAEGRLLVLQWSLHDLPATPVPEATQAPATTTPDMTGRSVDEDFMALMARGRQATAPEPEPAVASSGQQLAARLGLTGPR
ncbi:MAG: hypothetical protein IPN16_25045 [Gemmatimonadetes bacterium]|nr:hypothetical protein [Gemmatimonadota bacterium]